MDTEIRPFMYYLREACFRYKDTHGLKVIRWKKVFRGKRYSMEMKRKLG